MKILNTELLGSVQTLEERLTTIEAGLQELLSNLPKQKKSHTNYMLVEEAASILAVS
jgi:hypothetical protein